MSKPTLRCAQVLNQALHSLFESHPEVYLIGEDLRDPYGGAFKVSAGLSSAWPDRVLTTPISEAAMVGMASGMALRGLRPIVEIMFGDFVTLVADPLVNYAAKFRQMYNDQVRCPIVIRAPMGGRRGYGPTHSQTMERLFLSVPGLNIVAPSHLHELGQALVEVTLHSDDPTLFVENKLLYGEPHTPPENGRIGIFACRTLGASPLNTLHLSLTDFEYADMTLMCYGGMSSIVMQAAEELLMEHEISCEILIPSRIKPMEWSGLVDSLTRTGHLTVIEEGPRSGGWGALVAAETQERHWDLLRGPVQRVAAKDGVIPSARPLEDLVLPGKHDIVQTVLQTIGGKGA